MTRLQPFTDPELFHTAGLQFWQAHPAKSNLQWALAEKAASGKGNFARAFILYRGSVIQVVGLQTDLPRPLVLQASGPLGSQDVQLIETYCGDLPGLVTSKAVADDYLYFSRYEKLGTVNLIGYQLHELISGFKRPNGKLVPASMVPIELITEWLEQFLVFIEETGNDGNYPAQARKLVDSGKLYVYLLDGVPVSMAGSTRSQGRIAAINHVFTPEHLRKNGYAYSCVGELSQLLLRTHDSCVLYADKDYPASNRVYQKLGYVELEESVEILF